jgi:plastocyanin
MLVFAAPSHAAVPIEAVGSSSWSNSTQTITTAETVTFKNSTGLPHGVKWDAGVPATPNCPGVPTGTSSGSSWEGDCSFSQAGGYQFVCSVHANMTGNLTVNSAGPQPPTATSGSASAITDTGATLGGTVNPNGEDTEYFFEYGTSTTYTGTTTPTGAGAGTSNVTASAAISGLSPATTYHFRLVAESTSGTTEGADRTFTTSGPPLATTSPATPVTNTAATLRATVNPRGHSTTYSFEWGETASYGEETSSASAGSGASNTSVSAALTGLSPATTYHFRIVASNSSGDATGSDQTFTTTSTAPDTTDPQTTINTKPADPSSSTTAEFTYGSNEAGSTFECRMDGEAFTPCASTGKTYTGLVEGQHTFQVRATDPSLNTDESPAGYSFSVVLPVAQPEVVPPKVDPPPPSVDPPPAVAPNTTITLKPKAKTKDRTPTFKFRSTVAGATFKCTLDGKALKPCRSPLTTKKLSFRRHTLKVSAVVGGESDPTPAAFSFKVVKP